MIRHIVKQCCARERETVAATIALTIFLIGFTPILPAASVPVLMILEHVEGDKRIATKIETKDGPATSPQKGKPQQKWFIRAGEAIQSASRPVERTVTFYKGTGIESTPLFLIKVRYYLNSEGRWVPQFQLNEEPLVVWKNGRWQPLTTIQGVPSLIVQSGTALPNAEGYSSSLELGFTTGTTTIDAWLIQ